MSSLLIALIFLPDPLAMLNVENERKELTSMVDEPEPGGPEIIAASAECDVDVGINNVERLDRAARLRGMIDNSISMRSAMSTKGRRGGRYYYFIVIDYATDHPSSSSSSSSRVAAAPTIICAESFKHIEFLCMRDFGSSLAIPSTWESQVFAKATERSACAAT